MERKDTKGGFLALLEINAASLVCFVRYGAERREDDANYSNICFYLLNEKRRCVIKTSSMVSSLKVAKECLTKKREHKVLIFGERS